MELKPVLLAAKVHTYICISIYLSIDLSIYRSIDQSINRSINQIYSILFYSILYYLSIYLSIYLLYTPLSLGRAYTGYIHKGFPASSANKYLKKYLFAPDIASVSRERKMRSHIYKAAAMESYGTSPLSGKSWLHNGPWFP